MWSDLSQVTQTSVLLNSSYEPYSFLPSRGKRNWIVPSCPDHSVLGGGWSTYRQIVTFLNILGCDFPDCLFPWMLQTWLVARATTKSCQLSVNLMFLWKFKHLGLPGSLPCQWLCNELWQMPFEKYFILWSFTICFAFCFSLCMWWDPLGTFEFWKVIIVVIELLMFACTRAYLCALEHLWMSQDSMQDEFSSSTMWDWTQTAMLSGKHLYQVSQTTCLSR